MIKILIIFCRNRKSKFVEKQPKRSKIVYGIASAMAHLHRYNIVHRDLKPENIFLDENFNPILAYFGLSKFYKDKITMISRLGTPYYMSPEFFDDDKEITNKIDVYAFGITLLSLFTTKLKFVEKQPRSINQSISKLYFKWKKMYQSFMFL